MNSQAKKLKQPVKQNFTDFKHMYGAGPSYFTVEFPKGKVNIRTLTGACDCWNQNIENLVALDLRKHEPHIDGYVFCIYSSDVRKAVLVGWILFDELLGEGQSLAEDGTIYLTIPIRELRSMKEFDRQAKRVNQTNEDSERDRKGQTKALEE